VTFNPDPSGASPPYEYQTFKKLQSTSPQVTGELVWQYMDKHNNALYNNNNANNKHININKNNNQMHDVIKNLEDVFF
jgi:hypothetical protein